MIHSVNELASELAGSISILSMRVDPWDHVWTKCLFPVRVYDALTASFDQISMARYKKERTDKSYSFSSALLQDRFCSADQPWQQIANVLQGSKYREAVARLAGMNLTGARVTLNMWEYGPGDWLGPHLDHPDKLVTQVFYLSPDWKTSDGGRLMILDGDSTSELVSYAPAVFGSSFIFIRSDRSWHAVEPIAKSGGLRRSMTLTYWTT